MIHAGENTSIASEFEGAELSDRRLSRRLTVIAELLHSNPSASFPTAFASEAELEGFYRFLNNDNFETSAILQPHCDATMRRAQEAEFVIAAHDSTCIDYGGEVPRKGLGISTVRGRQGYVAHVTLLVGEKNGLPLGVASVETLTRTGTKNRKNGKTRRVTKEDPTRESSRWLRAVNAVEDSQLEGTKITHVMDAEADFFELLAHLMSRQASFVIRAGQLSRIVETLDGSNRDKLTELLETIEPQFFRELELQQRKPKKRSKTKFALKRHPPRSARVATIALGSTTIRMGKSSYSNVKASFKLNVVRVWEPSPVEGEPAVDWVLFTNQPARTQKQIARVVEIYRRRWIIEDFFKALKTGCNIEKRQVESYEGLRRVLMLFIPIAYRLLLLRGMERLNPNTPATEAFTEVELTLLTRAPATRGRPYPKTIKDALLLLARLGGHLRHNGPPGWLTLARGLQKLMCMVEAVEIVKNAGKSAQI